MAFGYCRRDNDRNWVRHFDNELIEIISQYKMFGFENFFKKVLTNTEKYYIIIMTKVGVARKQSGMLGIEVYVGGKGAYTEPQMVA